MKITIIGGGIIGLSSAWFLNNAGHEVTVIDKTDMQNNCSYGNAGYVCPSHFVPLATPGIVTQPNEKPSNHNLIQQCLVPIHLW